MIARRKFIIGAGSVLAAPFVVRSSSALVGTPRVRKDVMALSPGHPFFSSYADAVRAMHERNPNDPRSWNRQALIHIQFCPHGGLSYFLHWHRYYIKFFEEICGEILGNMDFALPYWNWQSGIGRVPNPFYDVDELNVAFWNDPSGVQSDNWSPDLVTTTGVRALAKGEGLKRQLGGAAFRDRQIRSIQRQTDFSVYSSMLEMHPHNLAHTLVGGTDGHMGDGMSPLDPIFWLHHSNVDRLTAEWQAAGNSMPPDNQIWEGQFFTGQGKGTAVVSGDAVDIGALGYAYETPSGLITGPTAPVERSLFEASSPRIEVLGATRKTMQAMANNTTSVSVDTSNLPQALLSPHSFRLLSPEGKSRIGAVPGSVLARIDAVNAPSAARGLVVNVFVNLPQADPQTPDTDPHYAGSFSFFGMAGKTHPSSYLVDLTDALTNLAALGLLESAQLTVQIVPLPVGPNSRTAGFSFGGVEILRS